MIIQKHRSSSSPSLAIQVRITSHACSNFLQLLLHSPKHLPSLIVRSRSLPLTVGLTDHQCANRVMTGAAVGGAIGASIGKFEYLSIYIALSTTTDKTPPSLFLTKPHFLLLLYTLLLLFQGRYMEHMKHSGIKYQAYTRYGTLDRQL